MKKASSKDRIQHWLDFIDPSQTDLASTQCSQQMPREILLQAKGKEYEVKKHMARVEKEKEDKLLTPFHPLTNASFTTSNELVENRLLKAGQIYSQKLQEKRKEKSENERKEEEKLKIKPRPASAGRSRERLYGMHNLYKQKQIQRQIEEAERVRSELKDPELCKRSLEIAEKKDRPNRVEDRLIEQANKSVEMLNTKRLISEMARKWASKPTISPMARKIKRSGNVSERLSKYSFIYEDNLNKLKMKYEDSIPHPKSPSKIEKREVPLMDRPKSPIKEPEIDFPFKPQLCKRSLEMAKSLGKSTERLLRASPSPTNFTDDKECSFSPLVNKNSEKLDRRQKTNENGDKTERWEALYNLRNLNSERRRELIDERLEEEGRDCAFHPLVMTPQKKEFNPEKLLERLNGWESIRKEKIQRTREDEIEGSMKKCTFRPEICDSPYSSKEINFPTDKGVQKYIEKQLSARKRSLESTPRTPEKKPKSAYKELSANDFLLALQKLHVDLCESQL
ncbi:unnamed protein product [Blepharisma stoltei]|uniref:Uncharacterized protein n=1 Tax=Blepharisma stoltei TaxID=1481888 RepID=A0AAU9KLY0_9CILI|nr:unnamed protein product [Blepharisma stoltei]